MNISRRTMLWSAAIAVAAVSRIGRSAAEALQASISLRIFDSRSAASRAWAESGAAGAIDAAHENANRWLNLRNMTPPGRVAGLTAWSDFVQARGVLEQKGKRLRAESRSGRLFYWEMV
jgi:hypothetical protein